MLGSRSACFLRSFTATTRTTIRQQQQQQRVVVCSSTRALSSSQTSSMLHFSPKFAEWATIDPSKLGSDADSKEEPYAVPNLVNGQWQTDDSSNKQQRRIFIPHPLDRDAPPIFSIPDTPIGDAIIQTFIESLRRVPKSGLHNPLKNPERYLQYGEISRKVCCRFRRIIFPAAVSFFAILLFV
jgi:hypothetical protein